MMNNITFSDKVNGKEDVSSVRKEYKCDKCRNSKLKFFIHMDIDGEDKYICSYLCSKDMHITYGKNYFQNVVNTEDFNHPKPLVDNVVNDKFKVNKDIYDSERYDFLCELEDEDKRVELFELACEQRYSSNSDSE
tara:strand:- start:73 stop:477 length:405 start_codon:yes stop_codon:yes gene_type:complete